MTAIFAEIGMFAWLPVALPVVLAAVAGCGRGLRGQPPHQCRHAAA